MSGGVFLEARLSAPWSLLSRVTAEDCAPYFETPKRIVAYHFIFDGDALAELGGVEPQRFRAGEAVIFPRNDAHVIASAAGLRPVKADDFVRPAQAGGLAIIDMPGEGPTTRLFCGYIGVDELPVSLIAALPAMMKVDLASIEQADWVEHSLRYAALELRRGRLASSPMLSRLSELLFIEAVRAWAKTSDAALGDQIASRAAATLAAALDRPWTSQSIAETVGLSRSALNARFRKAYGVQPMAFLTRRRLDRAQELLLDPGRSLADIAHRTGYGSEAAFSRAFKRAVGISPGEWRRRER